MKFNCLHLLTNLQKLHLNLSSLYYFDRIEDFANELAYNISFLQSLSSLEIRLPDQILLPKENKLYTDLVFHAPNLSSFCYFGKRIAEFQHFLEKTNYIPSNIRSLKTQFEMDIYEWTNDSKILGNLLNKMLQLEFLTLKFHIGLRRQDEEFPPFFHIAPKLFKLKKLSLTFIDCFIEKMNLLS